jgi:hypothetical protein
VKNFRLLSILLASTLFSVQAVSGHHEESATTQIGDVEMSAMTHSDGFNQMKNMLGKWEGKLTQFTGAVIDVSSEFKLVAGGNLIAETLIEDGVEMLTTYSDNKDGELVVKHYCALGTQPVFKVSQVKNKMVEVSLDGSHGHYHPEHHSYVNSMKWTIDADNADSAVVDATLYIDGELVKQQSVISRSN